MMYSFSAFRGMCVVLCACLLLPALRSENLLCYYCPLLMKEKACSPSLAECSPQELCSTATGRYGGRVVISAKGCMSEQDCQLEHTISYKGMNMTMSYSCCDWHYCNSAPHINIHPAPVALALAAAVSLPAWLR